MSSREIGYTMAPVYVAAVRDVRCHSIACLTLLVWHLFLTLDEDVQYIWTMRNRNPLKWAYFFLRYIVILGCVTHNCLAGRLGDGSNPPMLCSIWYIYIIAFTQILSSSLEFILAVRIFALYNRSRRIAILLSALIVGEIGGAAKMTWFQREPVHETCLLIQLTERGRNRSLLGFIVHCVFIGLTLFKYFLAFRAGWNRTPLVSLVIRDGSTMYATISFFLVSVLVIFGLENVRAIVIIFWAISLLSLTGCRMILSMERFARRESLIDHPQLIFTSQFSMEVIESHSRRDQSIA